jgi:hypothetical protein
MTAHHAASKLREFTRAVTVDIGIASENRIGGAANEAYSLSLSSQYH